jgi:ribose transport system permease protein
MIAKLQQTLRSKEFWLNNIVYIVMVFVFILVAIANPLFISRNNIISLFTQSCTMILVGIGVTMCILTRGIDLSVGSTMYISAAVMYMAMHTLKSLPVGAVIFIGLAVGLIIGLVNGVIVATLKVYPLLPTLATMYALRGIGLSIAGASVNQMPMKWAVIISTRWLGIPAYVFITFALAIIAQIFLNKTNIGRRIYATGDNEKMAIEKGINVFNIKLFVYGMSGLLAGLAATLSSAMTMQASYTIGDGFEFKVITAAVLGGVSLNGGRGTIAPGILIGAIILTFISNQLVLLKASPYSYDIVFALVIFAVVVLDTIKIRNEENNLAI